MALAGIAARMLPIRFLGEFHLDCGKPFNPRTQVIREYKCATTPFDGAQLARLNRRIECGPAGTRHSARLDDGVRQRCIHLHFATLEAGMVPATVPAFSRTPAKRSSGEQGLSKDETCELLG
jgi:hypothetical protein